MGLEAVQVADAVAGELGADELAAGVPEGAVGGEDAVAEEGLPLGVEGLALAVVGELGGEYGLDILRVGGEEGAAAQETALGGPEAVDVEGREPVGVLGVLLDGADEAGYEVQACPLASVFCASITAGLLSV